MISAGFCKKTACLICFWCVCLPYYAFAGVLYQKEYVIKLDLEGLLYGVGPTFMYLWMPGV